MLLLDIVPNALQCQMHTDGYKLGLNPWPVLAANVFQAFTIELYGDAIPTCSNQVCVCFN